MDLPAVDPADLELFATFIVPGFITVKIWDLMAPTTRRDFSKMVIELVAYSMIFFPVVEFLRSAMQGASWDADLPLLYAIAFLGTIILIPAFFTWLFYRFWVRVARKTGAATPVPTAWDYAFTRPGPFWVYFHMKEGPIVAGFFGDGSSAGTGVTAREVFVRDLRYVDDQGNISKAQTPPVNALIRQEDCTLIEFQGKP